MGNKVSGHAAQAPVGDWQSPISSELIVSKTIKLSEPCFGPGGSVCWLEGRPEEGGRSVLVCRQPDGSMQDVIPGMDSGFNVRTTVHEYGGAAFVVDPAKGMAYFSNFKDQRLYCADLTKPGSDPRVITKPAAEGQQYRFADACWDASRERLVAVMEHHTRMDDPGSVHNSIVAIDVVSGEAITLAEGADFYAAPRVSPDGARLAWLQWNFPNMPWDGTELHAAHFTEAGQLQPSKLVAGGLEESVQQPLWAGHSGVLYFISDKSGWWNLYAWHATGIDHVEALHPATEEFGGPLWTFGMQSYQVDSEGGIWALCSSPDSAGSGLVYLHPPHARAPDRKRKMTHLKTGFSHFGSPPILRLEQRSDPAAVPPGEGGAGVRLLAVAAAPDAFPALLCLQGHSLQDLLRRHIRTDWHMLKSSAADVKLDSGYISAPRVIGYPSKHGKRAYMNFYPPTNKDFRLPRGDRPPLLVMSHGGPTSSASVLLNLSIQYWTSRGFAVADVDYGGSTGYGREYRNRLRGAWGIVDVDDCSDAATFLAKHGRADPARLCITGGSAGGFTTLACLAFRKAFSAGSSLYGVADLRLLAEHTHKFESRYLDQLLGPLPAAAQVYADRSPLQHAQDVSAPVIFFQGDADKVVPPEQAVAMHDALKARGMPTALVMFAGEQHGFRQAANIRTAMDGQLYFFGKVLGFNASMPPGLPDIIIDNLPAAVQTVHTVQAGTSKAGAESAQAVGGAESARHADVGVPALQADPQPA